MKRDGSPRELVEALHRRQGEARLQLWTLLRQPVERLLDEMIVRHKLQQDRDTLVLHALHESGVHVPEISIPFSLTFICAVLVVTTITSLIANKKTAAREAAEKDDSENVTAEK